MRPIVGNSTNSSSRQTLHILYIFYRWSVTKFCPDGHFVVIIRNASMFTVLFFYYRPQRSCGKVIFSQASVSHSVHRGGCLADTPPWADTPWADHTPGQTHSPPGRHPRVDSPLGRHPPGQTPPGRRLLQRTVRMSYWNAFLLKKDLEMIQQLGSLPFRNPSEEHKFRLYQWRSGNVSIIASITEVQIWTRLEIYLILKLHV